MSSYNEWPDNRPLVKVRPVTSALEAYGLGRRAGEKGEHREVRKILLPPEVQAYFPLQQPGAVTRWDAFRAYTLGTPSDNIILTSQLPDSLLVVELGCVHQYEMQHPHFLMVNKFTCIHCGHSYEIDHGD